MNVISFVAALLLPCSFVFAMETAAAGGLKNGSGVRDTVPVGIPDKFPDTLQFTKVDVLPAFPGGLTGWRLFIERNLQALIPANNGAPVGRYTVMVQFIVNKDGSLSDLKALTRHGYGMEEEVLRLIGISPNWTPALLYNQPVKAYIRQPVTFVIEEEIKKKRRRG